LSRPGRRGLLRSFSGAIPETLMRPVHVRAALLLIPALLAVVVLARAEDKTPAAPVKDFKGATAYKVPRVIDGDTIEIEQDVKPAKVRLIGVDTPEAVHPSKPVEEHGKEASRFTTNLLKGESVYPEFDKNKQDKYGRLLAYVYRAPDGLFVNAEIIRQGYGHAHTKYPL
jgi:micrococcal nuclease